MDFSLFERCQNMPKKKKKDEENSENWKERKMRPWHFQFLGQDALSSVALDGEESSIRWRLKVAHMWSKSRTKE